MKSGMKTDANRRALLLTMPGTPIPATTIPGNVIPVTATVQSEEDSADNLPIAQYLGNFCSNKTFSNK